MKHIKLSYDKIRKATEEEKQEAIRVHAEYKRLGIQVNSFSTNANISKDEVMAMKLIVDNKPLTKDLEERIINKNKNRVVAVANQMDITDDDVAEFLC